MSSPVGSAPTTYLIESWLPKPVLPEQMWPGRRGHQGAVLIRFRARGPAPPLLGTQMEEQGEDGSHAHHQQGQVLGRTGQQGSAMAPAAHGSRRLEDPGVTVTPRLTRNTGTSWTPSWSPTLSSCPACEEPCRWSSSQAAPYTVMLATTVNAYLWVRGRAEHTESTEAVSGTQQVLNKCLLSVRNPEHHPLAPQTGGTGPQGHGVPP